jgi:20S proteasome alpha/beta subunit
VTLLVGVLCSNGVVIAADRQATHGAMGQQTVGQSVTKVQVIRDEALYATSGHKGLGQQLCAIVEGRQPEFKNQGYDRNIVKLQEAFRPIIDAGFKTASHAAGVIGHNVAASDCMCGGLLAAGFKDGLKLIEITPQLAVEYMTNDLPFISMGSGKPSADPFLGFLRKVYWPIKLPTIQEGALAAYWTIQHAIDMKIFGVGFGIDVFIVEVVSKHSGKPGKPPDTIFKARKLDDAELAEHEGFMKAAEEALRGVREAMIAPPAPQAPAETPPTLKSQN